MIPALLLNSGINLAVGLGLLLVWRVDRSQPFSPGSAGRSSRRRSSRGPT